MQFYHAINIVAFIYHLRHLNAIKLLHKFSIVNRQ